MTKSNDSEKPAAPTNSVKETEKTVNPWDMVEVGATVLYEEVKFDGWFECTVMATSKDRKTLTLKWRDYPQLKQFEVRRLAVGLTCKVK